MSKNKRIRPRLTPEEFRLVESFRKSKEQKQRRYMILPDLHAPFIRKDAFDWVRRYAEKYEITDYACTGDVVDFHKSSFHTSEIDALNADVELEEAIKQLKPWHDAFPNMKISSGNHDCYDENTEILTSDGWKLGIDLIDSDVVGTMNLSNGNFEFQKINFIVKYDYSGDMIHFKTENYVDLLVTPNHRIVNGQKDLPNYSRIYNVDSAYKAAGFGYRKFPVSCSNLEENPVFLTNDEIKLLAWIMSDGWIIKNSIFGISQSKSENIDLIKNILDNLGIKYQQKIRERDIKSICGVDLKSKPLPNYEFIFKYSAFSDLHDRYTIPNHVWRMPKHQFDIFLETFIKADGSVKKNKDGSVKGNARMIYGNKKIVDQLQALCIRNNHSATISEYRPNQYRLNIVLNKCNVGFKLGSNHKVVNYIGKVWCAMVDNTTLIVRRNGKPQIQGNCIPLRKIKESSLSSRIMRPFNEIMEVPTWDFNIKHDIGHNTEIHHGEKRAAHTMAKEEGKNIIMGHKHSKTFIWQYYIKLYGTVWAMQLGALFDQNSYAARYNIGGASSIPSVGFLFENDDYWIPFFKIME